MIDNEFGFIQDRKIYRKGFMDFPDRKIGEVRDSEEESVHFFEERFRIVEAKVSDLEKQIHENENKGSFLAKLLHLKKTLPEFDGLGDFEHIYNRLTKLENFLKDLIQKNRLKNLEIKRALLSELNLLKDHYNLKEAGIKIREIRDKWIRTGAVIQEYSNEIEDQYKAHLDYFFEREKAFHDDRRRMFEDYFSQYNSVLEKARVLQSTGSPVATEQIDELRSLWNKLPKIPGKRLSPLWHEFNSILHRIAVNDFPAEQNRPETDVQKIVDIKKGIIDKLEKSLTSFDQKNSKVADLKTKWRNLPKVFYKDVKLLDKKAYELFDKIQELEFIFNLGIKKVRGFENYSAGEQRDLMIKYLKDMVMKEKKELEKVQNNTGIIYSHDKNFQELLGRQERTKIRRIEIKAGLIEDLSSGRIKL